MDVTNYFRTNFSVDNLLGFNSDKTKNLVKHHVTLLNRKYDYKIPRLMYAVDYIGLSIANSIEKSDHYTFLLEKTPKDTVFLFADLLHFSKGGGSDFRIKPQLVGILSTEKIESLLNYEAVNDLGGSYHFYIKRTHVQ
jgi:hypothetical protein